MILRRALFAGVISLFLGLGTSNAGGWWFTPVYEKGVEVKAAYLSLKDHAVYMVFMGMNSGSPLERVWKYDYGSNGITPEARGILSVLLVAQTTGKFVNFYWETTNPNVFSDVILVEGKGSE